MRHVRIDPAKAPCDERPAWPNGVRVRERMSRPAVVVAAGTTIGKALRLMADRRIHYLPVVDEAHEIVGIVNADDLLGTGRSAPPRGAVVTTVMSAPAVTITPGASMDAAMRLMADRGVGALPVVEGRRVVGIFTQSDVVTAVAGMEPR
jgi:CBS domain-containing protein